MASATPCPGWIVRNGIIVVCGQSSCPDRNYHVRNRNYWRDASLAVGDHHKMRHALPNQPRPVLRCKDWVISEDGTIQECLQPFKPKKTPSVTGDVRDARYGPCHPKGRNQEGWKNHGYRLGDSVRRTCTYRNCDRGENGGRKTFDRMKRSPTGEYYCCEAHVQAERRLRKEDKWENKLAEAERDVAELRAELEKAQNVVNRLKRNKKPDEKKQDALIRRDVEASIPAFQALFALPEIRRQPKRLLDSKWTHPDFSPQQLSAAGKAVIAHAPMEIRPKIAARWFISIKTGLSFDTVARYHGQKYPRAAPSS